MAKKRRSVKLFSTKNVYKDGRTGTSYSRSVEFSLELKSFLYSILLLLLFLGVVGLVLMCMASFLGRYLVFHHYTMRVFVFFVGILVILFQGMKLIFPTDRESSRAIFLYSGFLVLGTFLLRAFSAHLQSPLCMFGLVLVVMIIGAWMGFWAVRKLVGADGGILVDTVVAWTWLVASVMILRGSLNPLVAVEACLGGIIVSKVIRHCCYVLGRLFAVPAANFTRSSVHNPVEGSGYSDSETFYSSFHDVPDRRKYAKEEWQCFTKECTRKALQGLVSTPEFTKWAVSNAEKLNFGSIGFN